VYDVFRAQEHDYIIQTFWDMMEVDAYIINTFWDMIEKWTREEKVYLWMSEIESCVVGAKNQAPCSLSWEVEKAKNSNLRPAMVSPSMRMYLTLCQGQLMTTRAEINAAPPSEINKLFKLFKLN
jgi:hypothetical protein